MSEPAEREPDQPADAELLRQFAQTGSQEAFGKLVDRHVDLVFKAAVRHLRSRHDAEDVTQAVFIALAQSASQMDRKVILPAWLYRATRYACLNARRAQLRRKRHEMASKPPEPAAGPEASSGAAEAIWDESLPLLDDALASLGETDRTLLILRFFQGMSVQDVARSLGMSANTASQRMGRAVDKLRRFFARRGIAVTAMVIASGLAAQRASAAAPVALASSVKAAALSALGTTTSTTAVDALAKAALFAMKTSIHGKQTAMLVGLVILLIGTVSATVYLISASGNSGNAVVMSDVPANGRPAPLTPVVQRPAAPLARLPIAEYLPGGTIPVLADASRKDDRGLGQTIEAELFDESDGVYVEAPGITGWANPAQVRYDYVDFSSPDSSGSSPGSATHFFANIACPAGVTGAKLEVRLGDPAAVPICVLPVEPNGGILQRGAESAALTRPVTGRHTVYLTMSGGAAAAAVNLDWFKFVHLPRLSNRRIDAEHFDAMRGVTVTDAGLAHLDKGDYLRYRQVQFTSPISYVHVRCGVRKRYAGQKIQFRADAINGPVIAELTVRDTGEFTTFQTQTAPARTVTGTHDLYVTFAGNGVANLRWFQFTASARPPEYTDPDFRLRATAEPADGASTQPTSKPSK